jgi:hypothetical protein
MVSGRELVEAFSPTADEVAWARGKTQNDQHLLALVVRLKSYQRLGYFPKLTDVPAVVVDQVRSVLGLPDEVAAETDADRTAKRHRQFVREHLGVKYEAAKVRVVAESAIRTAVQTKDNPAEPDQRGVGGAGPGPLRAAALHDAGRYGRDDPHGGQLRVLRDGRGPAGLGRAGSAGSGAGGGPGHAAQRVRSDEDSGAVGHAGQVQAAVGSFGRRWTRSGRPRCGWRLCRRGRSCTSPVRRGWPTSTTCARPATRGG